jgi:cell wall-associated NlpC family hydrolase
MQGNLYWAGNSGPDPADQYQIRTTTSRRTDVNYQTGRETNTNEFAVWMRGGAQPSLTSKMNCWEAIMFGAFRAGLVTEARLRQLHVAAAAAGVAAAAGSGGASAGNAAYMRAVGNFLGLPAAIALTTSAEPRRGDLVFFGGLTHVALSIGNETVSGVRKHNVMSLWHLPGSGANLVSVYQRTSVEDLITAAQSTLGMTLGAITFGPAPWT